ncbi:MAG: small GTP-binding domain protein, Arf-/Gtr1/RagA G protein domain signature [Candidatus Lokiarchaeum sp. GC14_75]|nr:MAG: small GTP-binding domain protein, Arf-/Gtr1/RagA G protein domain signature [Candidatus Lokiarchaeum sp. GC14_75]
MSDQNSKSVMLKDFFKRSVLINEIDEVLRFKPDTLIGVDKVSSDQLSAIGIKSISDLAKLSVANLPEIKQLLPSMLIKWVKISQVIQKNIQEQLRRHKKILMVGLDAAGKTSILSIVQEKFSLIKSLLPTRGVKREKLDFFGYPIISWDLGGQTQYIEKLYFNRPELFFTEADIMLYVVDTQDPDRFPESANYFREVLKAFEKLKEKPAIVIVLSKSDPDIRKTLQWQQNETNIMNKFTKIADDFEEYPIDFCDTSVFQRETIMQMFSVALKKVSDTSEIIENILEDFASQVGARASSLVSMDGLIFGSYTDTETDEMLVNNTALLLQTLSNFYNSIGLIREKSISLDLPLNGFTIRGEKLFDYSDLQIPVYLWAIVQEAEKLESKLDYFKEQLLPLINLFL